MSPETLEALWLTLKLAMMTSLCLTLIGFPLAWYLAQTTNRFKPVIESIIALPLVLPPTVLGFYLLMAFAPDAWFGSFWMSLTGERLAFSFEALVIGSMIYSLPFVIQPMQLSFSSVSSELLKTASTLGASPLDRFFNVVLPICRGGVITAFILGFAHTIGEFGVVLMIGGNIPGETQVLSIALYDQVETMNYSEAHETSLLLLVMSFVMLLVTYQFQGSPFKWFVKQESQS